MTEQEFRNFFALGLCVNGVARRGKKLSDYSWTEISDLSASGTAASMFSLGDTKDITMTTGEVLTVCIIGFNHDNLADGSGKAGITFGMLHNMAEKMDMHSENTTDGGWDKYLMRSRLQPGGEIYGAMPADLTAHIRPVVKLTAAASENSAIIQTVDYCFLLSEVEVFGYTSFSFPGEGTQYSLYSGADTDSELFRKRLANGAGDTADWFLRSPNMTIPDERYRWCCDVSSDNEKAIPGNSRIYGHPEAVSFAFCI